MFANCREKLPLYRRLHWERHQKQPNTLLGPCDKLWNLIFLITTVQTCFQEENSTTVYVFSGKYRLDLFYIAPFYASGNSTNNVNDKPKSDWNYNICIFTESHAAFLKHLCLFHKKHVFHHQFDLIVYHQLYSFFNILVIQAKTKKILKSKRENEVHNTAY